MAPALPGALLGPSLQLQQAQLWPAANYLLLVLAGAVLLAWCMLPRWSGVARAACIVAGAALLAGGITGLRASVYVAQGLDAALEGRDIVLTGVVAAMPHRNEAGLRFRLQVESARAGGSEVAVPPHVLLGWYGGPEPRSESVTLQRQPADLRPGERWQLAVRLKAPHGHVNPHGFDYELWLWEQGLQATGYVRAGPRDPPPQRLTRTWRKPVEQMRHAVRDAIFARVADPRLAGVLAALVVGDQGAIERADWDIFRATGVAHLMSISGLHVTMFAWVAALAIGVLWRRSAALCLAFPAQQAALLGGLGLAAGYAVFSGWGVPSQRTIWMLACVALLRLGAREWPWPWVWLLACVTVVTVDPWALTQPGFWLSFVAVGVLFASEGGGRPVHSQASRPAGWRGAVAALRHLLHEQWVVTVALTPLSLLLFGQVSVVGLVANLVAIPWVTLVVTPLGLAGVAVPSLWLPAAWAIEALGRLLQGLAQVPGATWSAPAPPLWAGAVGVMGGLLLAMRLPWSTRVVGLPLLLPVLLWQAPRPASGEFELIAADVGQGNAVLVRTATHTLVYDTGPGYTRETDAGQRVLVPLLRALDEKVDLVVLSHRDQDHTGGAGAVLRMQPQAGLLSSIEAAHGLQALRPAVRCESGQHWIWDSVRFEMLHPRISDYEAGGRANGISCVLRISNTQASALLPGDIERPQELTLAADPARLRADLLLVPHHGSKTSSTDAFLDAVQPTVALVQAGYRNRFGHPAVDVVERYRGRDVVLFLSASCGAARWNSAQPARVRCERSVTARYWRHGAPAPGTRAH